MENETLLKFAEQLLIKCVPAERKDFGSYFLDKQGLIDLINFNGEIKDFNKILRATGFESGFKKVGDKTMRGYWIKDQKGRVDVSNISFEKQKSEKEELIILGTEQEAIIYISDNWDEFKPFISPELRKIQKKDPYFRAVSSQKRSKLLLMAGFETKAVLNTYNRHVYDVEEDEEIVAKPKSTYDIDNPKVSGAMMILHDDIFPNSIPEKERIGYAGPK